MRFFGEPFFWVPFQVGLRGSQKGSGFWIPSDTHPFVHVCVATSTDAVEGRQLKAWLTKWWRGKPQIRLGGREGRGREVV